MTYEFVRNCVFERDFPRNQWKTRVISQEYLKCLVGATRLSDRDQEMRAGYSEKSVEL